MPQVRTSIPRGLLPRILVEAGEHAAAQQRLTLSILDEMTDTTNQPTLGKGARLTRQDYLTLLATDDAFQQRVLAKLPFTTAKERDTLQRDLQQYVLPYLQHQQAAAAALLAPAPMAPVGVTDGSLPFTAPVPLTLPGELGPPPGLGLGGPSYA